MAHIKEPKGVDFIVHSDPLTDETRSEISNFIKDYKNKTNRTKIEKTDKRPTKTMSAR